MDQTPDSPAEGSISLLTALVIYVVILALDAIGEPSTLFSGWFIKIAVIIALISALGDARETQSMRALLGKNK